MYVIKPQRPYRVRPINNDFAFANPLAEFKATVFGPRSGRARQWLFVGFITRVGKYFKAVFTIP